MDLKPLVSIIIPTYSRPNNIIRSIDSVINQTYNNIEIIVVDDNGEGTPYQLETEKVLNDYIKQNTITYIKHEVNKNGSAARNTGFRACHGEYVNFLDDDDVFMKDNIGIKVHSLINTPLSIGGAFSPVCYIKFDQLGAKTRFSTYYNKEGNILEDFLTGRAMFNTSGILFKRDAIAQINGFDESFVRHQDFELMIRFFRNYTVKLASSKPLYYMDTTSDGSHSRIISNRFQFEHNFLSIFKEDLSAQKCYHSVCHFLYWQCCLEYLSGKIPSMFFKSFIYSLRHGLFSCREIYHMMLTFIKS